MILPTRAEAFGIVYLEAAAFALPSIAPDVMGVGSAVLDGKTGILLPKDSDGKAYASAIQTALKDRKSYETLCKSALNTYAEKFTWSSVGRQIREFMIDRA